MHKLAKNLKKIRNVKNLSQKSFAEIFDLKRATLGAYEEGRSEPKIEVLIKIANYFSITLNQLLCQDLTMNELLHFDDHLSKMTTTTVHKQSYSINISHHIKWIEDIQHDNYANTCHLSELEKALPNFTLSKDCLPKLSNKPKRAFSVKDLNMSYEKTGFFPKDIVICERVNIHEIQDIQTAYQTPQNFIVVTKTAIHLRKIERTSSQELKLYSIHPYIEDLNIKITDIQQLWIVIYRISSLLK